MCKICNKHIQIQIIVRDHIQIQVVVEILVGHLVFRLCGWTFYPDANDYIESELEGNQTIAATGLEPPWLQPAAPTFGWTELINALLPWAIDLSTMERSERTILS